MQFTIFIVVPYTITKCWLMMSAFNSHQFIARCNSLSAEYLLQDRYWCLNTHIGDLLLDKTNSIKKSCVTVKFNNVFCCLFFFLLSLTAKSIAFNESSSVVVPFSIVAWLLLRRLPFFFGFFDGFCNGFGNGLAWVADALVSISFYIRSTIQKYRLAVSNEIIIGELHWNICSEKKIFSPINCDRNDSRKAAEKMVNQLRLHECVNGQFGELSQSITVTNAFFLLDCWKLVS